MAGSRTFIGVDYGSRRWAIAAILELPDGGFMPGVRVEHYGSDWSLPAMLDDTNTTVRSLVRSHDPWSMAVESPIVGASRNPQTAVKLAMMAGAIVSGAERVSGVVDLVPPASWKATVVGHGHASKGDIAEWLSSHWPDLYRACFSNQRGKFDQDIADALCLALYARTGMGSAG